jgi:hypothetical protein
MDVIVKVAGFYGGRWYEAGPKAQAMPAAVAKQYLPPYGDQLEEPSSKRSSAPVKAAAALAEKKAD